MYQQKCPIYRNSKAVRDMVLLLMNNAFCDWASKLDHTARSPHQRHHNQPMYAGTGAGRARGWLGSFGFTSGCLSNFRPEGGLGTAILRPGGRKQSSRLVPVNNNTTIKQWTKGLGLKWPLGFVWVAVRTSHFYHVVTAKYHCEKSQ